MPTLLELRTKCKAALDRARAIKAAIDSGDLSQDEIGAQLDLMDAATEEHKKLAAEIVERESVQARLVAVDALEVPPMPRPTVTVDGPVATPEGLPTPSAPAVARDHVSEGRQGFNHFGEFAQSVMAACTPGTAASPDPRLSGLFEESRPQAAAAGLQQGVGSEGGFVIPPSFSTQIWDGLNELPDNLLSRTDQIPVQGQSVTIPANAETSRVTGSRYGGVRGYWIQEADAITVSKPTLRRLTLEPNELAVLVPATDKSLRNSAGALETYLRRASVDEINFMVGDAIVNGNGAGKPLGIMTSGSLITVSKETGQAADTFTQTNAAKMWARLHQRARATAVWLINQDVDPQLMEMVTNVENVAGSENVGGFTSLLYNPTNDTLVGRPIIRIEYAQTLGDLGDVLLTDLQSYATGIPAARNSIDVASSIHLYFSTAETAFRFMFEIDGQPYLKTALTPANGSNTLSTAVTLAARA